MDDILFSEITQTEIDNLFGTEMVAEEVVQQVEEPIDTHVSVSEDFIDALLSNVRSGEELQLEEVAVPEPEVIKEELTTITEPPVVKSFMQQYADVVSSHTKTEKTDPVIMTEDERFRSLETQLIQVRQLVRESTMVSGIGQGGDGQTPGSGEVRFAKLDDVVVDGINIGDTIIWDGNNFVPGMPSGGGGGGGTGTVTTADVDLTNPSTGNFNTRSVVLHPNFPMSGDYTTQEDANTLFTECLNYLELGKAMITVGPDIPDDAYVTLGDLYVDDTYDMFVFNGNTWVQVGGGGAGGVQQDYVDDQLELKVDKAGDTMNGDLQFKSLTADNYLHINSLRPDGWTSGDSPFGLEINLADGNTYKNQLRVRGRSDKDIVRLWIQDEQRIETTAVLNLKPPANLTGDTAFVVCRDTNNHSSFSIGANGTVRAGTELAPFIASKDHHLVTKKFSDERLLDVQNQIDNLEASNLSTTTLNYIYTTGTVSNGQFKTSSVTPANVTSISFSARDSANRVFPALNTGDVITTRLATGTAPVQTFKVVDGSNPSSVTVTAESTTSDDYTDTDTYIVTIGHSFDGFATTEYVDTKVAITGDTMTGPLILSGDPGTGLQAATKDYVDNAVTGNTPNLTGYIKADGTVSMTGTFKARNIEIDNNASLLFTNGTNYIKVNNGRSLGIYGYSGGSFTSSYSRNIEVQKDLTEFRARVNMVSNCISTRSTGYAFEVKPGDVQTRGGWNTSGAMFLMPDRTGSNDVFTIQPTGLDADNNKKAFYVRGDGKVKAGHNNSEAFMATDDNDVVTKKALDAAIDDIPDPTFSPTQVTFPGQRFRWVNSATPLSGTLSYFSSGEATGGVAMRVHFNSRDGRWAIPKNTTFNDLKTLFAIYWDDNGTMTPVRIGIIYEMQWMATQEYVHIKLSQHETNGGFVTGRDYYLTIGGIL